MTLATMADRSLPLTERVAAALAAAADWSRAQAEAFNTYGPTPF